MTVLNTKIGQSVRAKQKHTESISGISNMTTSRAQCTVLPKSDNNYGSTAAIYESQSNCTNLKYRGVVKNSGISFIMCSVP